MLASQDANVRGLASRPVLQNALVYVNTLMMENVLTEPAWSARMAPEDYRGLTPFDLFPRDSYDAFNLDLERRLDFEVSCGVNLKHFATRIARMSHALTTGFQLNIEALPAKS